MEPRTTFLASALERARARVSYCKRELDRFNRITDGPARAGKKLADDLRKAELDCGWIEHAMTQEDTP